MFRVECVGLKRRLGCYLSELAHLDPPEAIWEALDGGPFLWEALENAPKVWTVGQTKHLFIYLRASFFTNHTHLEQALSISTQAKSAVAAGAHAGPANS